ncbi:MAG TPA: DNA topoisomerase I [Candidatus Nanoarchaeia archaeon]|nr:DNA topoisomerase I [Candidatus Nanoarchaeia archaeon]
MELIITEKPSQAKKIAEALADKKIKENKNKKISYYVLEHNGREITIVPSVGHLFNLAEKDKKGWTYPIFDLEWKPSYEIKKSAAFTKPYVETIKKLCKDVSEIIVATDYDIEGSTIGWNIVKFLCNKKDGKRMKFSTLTKDELVSSYENASKHLDFAQIEAGETRHFLDAIYGFNLSRALTLSIKAAGKGFKVLSTGRVQGPALKIIADRELEIKNFKSVPYWEIELIAEELNSWHEKDKFWDEKEAKDVLKKIKGKKAIVSKIEKKEFKQNPPNPFDLTSLQLEAYRTLRISPKQTLEIAQELYTNGLISYPRTSSQKLPPSIDYKKILEGLSKNKNYSPLCEELLKKRSLKPNDGKKEDRAHPAIYPVGLEASLADRYGQLYDLIVHRFLATFSEDATRETNTITIDVDGENFIAKGTRTTNHGWHKFYGRFLILEEQELPKLKEKQELNVKEVKLHNNETQPPKRYTPASIIKKMESLGLGTKATRSEIIDTLYQRNYISDEPIKATQLGIKTVEALEKYTPRILDQQLTKHFEDEMEEIQDGKKHKNAVIEEAKESLTKVLLDFKEKEKLIGASLGEAYIETQIQESLIGKCPVCKEGTLRITYSKKTKSKFIACNKYPDCKTTFSLPKFALIKPTKKECSSCQFPTLLVIRKGKRPYEHCINQNCPKKLEWIKQQAAKQ